MVRINDNRIYAQELRDLAGIVLRTLDEQKILSLKDLRANLGKKFSIKEFPEDRIEILERPSNYETKSLVLSYIREGIGIIINTISNERLRYSDIIVKGQFGIKGYSPFDIDIFGNLVMDKKISSEDFSVVRRELQKLTKPESYIQLNE